MNEILIAPDSFKGSLSANEVSLILKKELKKYFPATHIRTIPFADGGEGTVAALTPFFQGTIEKTEVMGPLLSQKIEASWFKPDKKSQPAIIEMACASGLPLLAANRRNPLHTTSYGTGELIKTAYTAGYSKIILGLGGSATCDGGLGAASAIGYRFYASNKHIQYPTGKDLIQITRIEKDFSNPILQAVELGELSIVAACDVSNPLNGNRGAAKIFAPQKGASAIQVKQLQKGLIHLTHLTKGKWAAKHSGSGAAGGFGFSVLFFFKGQLESGFQLIAKHSNLNNAIKQADLIITGEGAFDKQSFMGKPAGEILKAAKSTPVIIFCGHNRFLDKSLAKTCKHHHVCKPHIYSLSKMAKNSQEDYSDSAKQLKLIINQVAQDFQVYFS